MLHLAATLLLASSLASPSRGDSGVSGLARGISKASKKAGVSKVQIVPFAGLDGQGSAEGRMLASRLMSALIEEGDVTVVEGELPSDIPDPYTQAMGHRQRTVRSTAEAVILGQVAPAGNRLHVEVRLLRLADRAVLFSDMKRVKNEWEGVLTQEETRPRPAAERERLSVAAAPVEPPAKPAAKPAAAAPKPEEEETDCAKAADELDRLQSSIMDIKARYVARKLRAAGRGAADRPATVIQNEELQNEFDMTVQHYLDSSKIPPLSAREVDTLVIVDGKSFEIHRRCFARRS